LLHVEVEEINDMFDRQSVDQVSNDATKDEPKGELPGESAGVEVVTAEEQDEQSDQSYHRKQLVVARELTPGCPGVAPVDKLEEAVNHHFLVGIPQEAKHQSLSHLVQPHNGQGDERNPGIGVSQNGCEQAHAWQSRM
jgi:hypothetical protein